MRITIDLNGAAYGNLVENAARFEDAYDGIQNEEDVHRIDEWEEATNDAAREVADIVLAYIDHGTRQIIDARVAELASEREGYDE